MPRDRQQHDVAHSSQARDAKITDRPATSNAVILAPGMYLQLVSALKLPA